VLRTDASIEGIGGELFQQEGDTERVVQFLTRRLTSAETRYCTIELEALAVVWALKKSRHLIFNQVKVLTNHSNLVFMAHSSNRRV